MNGNSVSVKQFVAMVFIAVASAKILSLPVLLTKNFYRNGWLVAIGLCVFELVIALAVIIVLKSSAHDSFFDCVSYAIGRVASKIVFVAFGLWCTFKAILTLCSLRAYFTYSVFEHFPWLFYAVPIILVCFFFAQSSGRGIGRTVEIIAPITAVCIAMLAVFSYIDIDFSGILPIKITSIFGFPRFSAWVGDVTCLLTFNLKKKSKHLFLAPFIISVISCLIIVTFQFAFCSKFGDVGNLLNDGQAYTLLTSVAVAELNFGRLDTVIFLLFLISVYATCGIQTFSATKCFINVSPSLNKKLCASLVCATCYITSLILSASSAVIVASWVGVPSLLLQAVVLIIALSGIIKKRIKFRRKKVEKVHAKQRI